MESKCKYCGGTRIIELRERYPSFIQKKQPNYLCKPALAEVKVCVDCGKVLEMTFSNLELLEKWYQKENE